MTPLRLRMAEDMAIRNLSPHTQASYIGQVSLFARHFGKSPELLGPEQIRDYQLFLTTEKQLAPGSISIAVSALRFLYRVTLRRDWDIPEVLPAPRQPRKLPVVPSPGEVGQFLGCVANNQAPRHPGLLLRGRPAHLRGRQPAPGRHRQPAHGPSYRAGQGPQGPLRHALAAAAGDPAQLLAAHPAGGRVAVPGPDSRPPSHHVQPSSGPARRSTPCPGWTSG